MQLNTKSLAEVEIGIPVLAAGVYHSRIKTAEVIENRAQTGNNLKLGFTILDSPVTKSDGVEIKNNGQAYATRYISLVPSDKYDPDKNMKELAVAIGLAPEQDLQLEDLAGKIVNLKLSIQPARTDESSGRTFPESNSVDRVTVVKGDDPFEAPAF